MSVFLRNTVRNGRSLKVTLAGGGDGCKRLVSAIGDEAKDLAGDTVAERIEAGTAFSDADLAKMKEIRSK